MVQVGTAAFVAEAWCHPTTVTITGTTLAKDGDAAVAEFSDGYQLVMALTIGDHIATEGKAGTCIAGEGTGAVCIHATAGDEDGTMAANGFKGTMLAASAWKADGEMNDIQVDLPAGAAAAMTPATVNDAPAPKAAAPAAAKEGEEAAEAAPAVVAEPVIGEQLAEGMAKDAVMTLTYFQPKMAKTYAGLWRFSAKDSVTGYAQGPNPAEDKVMKKCMTAELTGASALVAGAAIAFGAASLF